MTDEQKIIRLYMNLYSAMIGKNRTELEHAFDDSFVWIHTTGMRQSKKEFISSVMDGTLNYYTAQHEEMQVSVAGDTAKLIGRSRISISASGTNRNVQYLQLDFQLIRKNSKWYFTIAIASNY